MIKKKKKVNINGNPLEAITIAEVKNSKFGFIGILFLFCLFGALIYYLPELEKYYQYYVKGNTAALKGTNVIIDNINENTLLPDEEETPDDKEIYYKFSETKSIEIDNVVVNDIVLNDNILSFNAVNNNDEDIVLKNTFLELYDDSNNLLQRIMIEGTLIKDEKSFYSYDLVVNPDSFIFKQILEENYDYVDLVTDENNIGTLVCNNENEMLIYTFKDYKLISVKESVDYNKNQIDYDNINTVYKKLVSKYRSLTGIKSSITEDNGQMHFELEIDYEKALSNIDDPKFYSKDVDLNVVSFELKSKFYTCK